MRFRSLYDDNPSMFFNVEQDGTMSSVNRYGAEMLGYGVDELIGRPFDELCPEELRPAVEGHIARCFEQPETLHRWEARKTHQDGSTLWVRTTARIVVAADGEPSLLVVCEDLTETRKIDGIFVKGILEDEADDVLVSSNNQVAHVLGKRTIAEYVENDQILSRMAEIGVDFVQGYGVGRPVPIGRIGASDA